MLSARTGRGGRRGGRAAGFSVANVRMLPVSNLASWQAGVAVARERDPPEGAAVAGRPPYRNGWDAQ